MPRAFFFKTKDVAALGDCAVLAVLCHPNFHSPLTDVQDLWGAVVNFARTVASEDCATVYYVLRSVAVCPFQVYLEQMLQPQFWIGTEFFVMVTMLYGVEVRVHFLDNCKNPQVESTVHFLCSSLPNSKYLGDVHCHNPISVLFHQYNKMNHCFYDRYNHFAMLLSFPGCPADLSILINNNLVAIEQPENQQWWKQAPQKGKEKTIKKKS
jgi:hypothetical protein